MELGALLPTTTAGEKEECDGLVIDDETTSATVEDEITKLLGLTHEPLDYVNPDGEFYLVSIQTLSVLFPIDGHLSCCPHFFQNVVFCSS